MTITPPEEPQVLQKRSPLPFVLGGCAFVIVCLVLFLAANTVYWVIRMRTSENPVSVSNPSSIEESVNQLPGGQTENGETLFDEENCEGCHSLDAGISKVGPSLLGIAERAGSTRSGYSREMYLYESIANPGAYVVKGYPGGIMPEHYRQGLSEQQMADLLAFLMTK